MTGFFIALQFLTRLPLPIRREIAAAELGRSVRWFPVAGALIGTAVALADLALAPIWPLEVRSAVAVALLVAITGGLHLDGLMDTCDALFTPASPERRLQIMADPHVGSFGVLGAASVLLLKYTAILVLPPPFRASGFIAMGALSRWAMVWAVVCYPSAREGGLGHAYKGTAGGAELAIATATAAALALLFAGLPGLGAMAIAALVTLLIARYAMAKLLGLTGDIYGAVDEAVEVGVAMALPPLWRLLAG